MTTTVPYESPQVASPSTIYLVQFMCYNSCLGGGKKPIEIIVTLEKEYLYLTQIFLLCFIIFFKVRKFLLDNNLM
jgi:hypothetical protein